MREIPGLRGKTRGGFFAGAIVFLFFAFSCAKSLNFSADVITVSQGQRAESRLYVSGGMYRIEPKDGQGYTIIREDRGLIWFLVEGQNAYMEAPFDPFLKPEIEKTIKGETGRALLGKETLEGQTVEKYEVTYKMAGVEQRLYQWFAPGLGIAVRTEAADGSFVVEMKDVKEAVQPEGLFEVPRGWRKVPIGVIPGFGGGTIRDMKGP